MAKIIDGKKIASEIETELAERVRKLDKQYKLSIIIAGNDYASQIYVKMKKKACEKIGLNAEIHELDERTTTEKIVSLIQLQNSDESVCGIMVQHPMPKHIDEDAVFNSIGEHKDVDGLNKSAMANLCIGKESFVPATPKGIITLLEKENISLEGKKALVIGRSRILGKPVALMLLNKHATVTIAHSKTENLPELVSEADVIVASLGKPEFIRGDWIKDGAVVIDAGYNPGNVGDVDFEGAFKKASYITPVPGGVGPMTITSLILQCVVSAERMDRSSL